eukprot:TRINITY_DN5862_c0_g1_i1.p1 TRINITY_DN5862_c0_g1~~TRINITY_DN5862_c0_g1_i1.p1  ORF type:complete len:546 (+),score=102.21 TRINITY_DN5862_c0_g1_i1:156-1640(+)
MYKDTIRSYIIFYFLVIIKGENMKFAVLGLVLYLGALSACFDANSFELRMECRNGVTPALAKAFSDTLSQLRYLELYDMSLPVKLFPDYGVMTFSDIKFSQFNIAKNFKQNEIRYNNYEGLVTFELIKNSSFKAKAKLGFNETFKAEDVPIYKHEYYPGIDSKKTTFAVTFRMETKVIGGSLSLGWNLTTPISEENNNIDNARRKILNEMLFPELEKEFNRHLISIANKIIYNDIYNEIFLTSKNTEDRFISLRNELKKFCFPIINGHAYLAFKFTSSIYNSVTRTSTPLEGTFAPSEFRFPVHLYLRHEDMVKLYFAAARYYAPQTVLIGKEMQKKYFGSDLTVSSLIPFCPKLADQFDPSKKLDFACTLLTTSSATEPMHFKCAFLLRNPQKSPVLVIDRLSLGGKLKIALRGGESAELVLDNTVFHSMEIRSVRLPSHSLQQLRVFLKPINTAMQEMTALSLMLKRKETNWEFLGAISNAEGDMTIGYEII